MYRTSIKWVDELQSFSELAAFIPFGPGVLSCTNDTFQDNNLRKAFPNKCVSSVCVCVRVCVCAGVCERVCVCV